MICPHPWSYQNLHDCGASVVPSVILYCIYIFLLCCLDQSAVDADANIGVITDKGCCPVGDNISDDINGCCDALHHLGQLFCPIPSCTLCQTDYMACLYLHHITNNALRLSCLLKWLCVTAIMKKWLLLHMRKNLVQHDINILDTVRLQQSVQIKASAYAPVCN